MDKYRSHVFWRGQVSCLHPATGENGVTITKFPAFYRLAKINNFFKQPATGPYPEPEQSRTHSPILFREDIFNTYHSPTWTTLTNQNSIAEEIKSRLRSGNACYLSVQNLLSSRLLSKNLKIKIYRSIILPVVLYGCENLSLILREERKLRLFENMVLRRKFGPRWER